MQIRKPLTERLAALFLFSRQIQKCKMQIRKCKLKNAKCKLKNGLEDHALLKITHELPGGVY